MVPWRTEATEAGVDGYEAIELFGALDGSDLLFGCRHMPAGRPVAGVVVCPPVLDDAALNYQREARLGRWLARSGLAVQRFHYRGTGYSGGDAGRLGFAALLSDARRAVEHLGERCGTERVGLLGTRVGGLVAARLARDVAGSAPLALWQPVVDPRRYVNEGVAAGSRDLLTTTLGQDLFEPAVVDGLVETLGVDSRPILIMQLHRRVGLAPELRTTVGRLESRGFPVEVAYDPTEEDWWRVHPNRSPSDGALAATSSWLVSQLAGPGRLPA
jgi:dienelactone hydrolase